MHQTNTSQHTILYQKCAYVHVHIPVTKWCIVGYGTIALWGVCYRSTSQISAPTPAIYGVVSAVSVLEQIGRVITDRTVINSSEVVVEIRPQICHHRKCITTSYTLT